MVLGSADRRDLEVLLERIDLKAMALSGRGGGAEWPPEPSERDGYGLLMLVALIFLVLLALSEWKLRIKRSSSLVRRETASLRAVVGCESQSINALWDAKVQRVARAKSAIQALAWSFPRKLRLILAEIRCMKRESRRQSR